MKKILLALSFFISWALHDGVNAQSCNVGNPTISNITITNNGSSCNITFDLSFDFAGNNGNKWKAIFIWEESAYSQVPSNFYGNNGLKVPTAAEINAANALATISINSNISATTTLPNYAGDNTDPTSYKPSLAYTSTATSLTIKGITVTVANCISQIKLKADVGASNANSFSQFGCLSTGELSFTANEPLIIANHLGCGSTSSLIAAFVTTEARDIFFRIYKDAGSDGIFTAADTVTGAVSNWYSTTTTFNATTNNYRSPNSGSTQYSYNVGPGEKFNVWIVAYAQGVANVAVELVANQCAPLPVSLKSFTASRVQQGVSLKWETASEQNNSGFEVQVKRGNDDWKTVGFVASKGESGNSSIELMYQYIDGNPGSGMSVYRLKQIDFGGKVSYSEMRTVKGEGQQISSVSVFPNPAKGNFFIVLPEENALYDLQIVDATGRMIRQFTSVKNNMAVSDVRSGQYLIVAVNKQTNQKSSTKIVIQ